MTETFNYKNHKLKILNGETFSLNQLKSRLHQMEIPFNINEKHKKSYYSQLYNQAIKNNNNKMKIIDLLISDSNDDSNNPNLKRQLIGEENNFPHTQKIPKINDDSFKKDFQYNQETNQKNPNLNNFTNMMNYNYNNNNIHYNDINNQNNPQRNINNNNINNNLNYHNAIKNEINNNFVNGNEVIKNNINQNINSQLINQNPKDNYISDTHIPIRKNYDNINTNIKNNNINTQHYQSINYTNNQNQNNYKPNNFSSNTPVQKINENPNIHNNFNQNYLNQTTNQIKISDYHENEDNNLNNQNKKSNNFLSFKNPSDVKMSSSIINGQNLNYQNQNDNYPNKYTNEILDIMNNINQQSNINLHNSIHMNNQNNYQNINNDGNEINTSKKIQNSDSIQNTNVSILDTQKNQFNNNNIQSGYSNNNNSYYYNNEPKKSFFDFEKLYSLLLTIFMIGLLGFFIYLISKYNLKIINFTKEGINTITNPKKFFGEFLLGNFLSLMKLIKEFSWKYLYQIIFLEIIIVIFFILKIRFEKKRILNEIFQDIQRRLNGIFNSHNEYSIIGGIPEKDIIKYYSEKYNISYEVFNSNYMPLLREMRRNNINIKIKEMNYNGENQLIWYWHE